MREFGVTLIALIIIGLGMMVPVLAIMYTTQYHYDAGKQTATNGVVFHTTIDMKNYEQLGSATTLFCAYGADVYTRSLKHETFTVCRDTK